MKKLTKQVKEKLVQLCENHANGGEELKAYAFKLYDGGKGLAIDLIVAACVDGEGKGLRSQSTVRGWLYGEAKRLGLSDETTDRGNANPAREGAVEDFAAVTAEAEGLDEGRTAEEIIADFIAPFTAHALKGYDGTRLGLLKAGKAATLAARRAFAECEDNAKAADKADAAAKADAQADAKAEKDADAAALADSADETPEDVPEYIGKRRKSTKKRAKAAKKTTA